MVYVTTLLLLLIVLAMSSVAIWLRNRMRKRYLVADNMRRQSHEHDRWSRVKGLPIVNQPFRAHPATSGSSRRLRPVQDPAGTSEPRPIAATAADVRSFGRGTFTSTTAATRP